MNNDIIFYILFLGGCLNMKKLNLSGRYSYGVTDCHFEDIPIFLKMADLGNQNNPHSQVRICRVVIGETLLFRSRVLRWRIVNNKYNQLILACRISAEEENSPCLYRVVLNTEMHEAVLQNFTSLFSKFERLKIWYDSIPDQTSCHF